MPRTAPSRRSPDRGLDIRASFWVLAGVAGMVLCCTIALVGPLGGSSLPVRASISIGCGLLTMLVLSPWRQIRRLYGLRNDICSLTDRLEAASQNDRDAALENLLLARDDELGDLSRAIHSTMTDHLATRRRADRLEKTVDERIRRATSKATDRLRREANTDPLTGLLNRRGLEAYLGEIFGSDLGEGVTMTVISLDLDRFKEVNDTLGHEVGDECLIWLGQVIRSSVRRGDAAVRLGGDEFVLLMPDQLSPDAHALARRVCDLFAQMPWPQKRRVARPTVSIGIVCARVMGLEAAEELLRHADETMYRSKRDGRSTITIHSRHVA